MGSLTLPLAGQVYLDTQAIIYSVETHARYWPVLEPLWQTARTGNVHLVSTELALMETLVGPLRSGDARLTTAYEQIFQSAEVRLLPITQAVLREAAQLRANIPSLRTPDALHAATARLSDCALFVTNDTGFRRVPGLPLALLDDVRAAP
jgi:predicted nucleic acid-binding protein